jgi:hypothetical protein
MSRGLLCICFPVNRELSSPAYLARKFTIGHEGVQIWRRFDKQYRQNKKYRDDHCG